MRDEPIPALLIKADMDRMEERSENGMELPGEMTVFVKTDSNDLNKLETCCPVDEKKISEEEHEREHWTRGMDFVLSLIGYAVGVSNLWRFPYLTLRNGGGAFLIPFFFFLILCGIPLFYLEVCLGQFSGISSLFVWRVCPLFKGLGYGMVIVSGMACIYYNAVLSWVIYYLINSFHSELPWAHCGHWWNTKYCVSHHDVYTDNSSSQIPYHNHSSSFNSSALLNGLQTFNVTLLDSMDNVSTPVLCKGNTSDCLEGMMNDSKYRTAAEEFWQ